MRRVYTDGFLLDRSDIAKDCATESAKLCSAMRTNFTDAGRDKTVLVDLTRWASVDPPSIGNGINFANVRYAVRCGGRSADRLHRARAPKSQPGNSYSRITYRLDYRSPVGSVNRMRRSPRSTLSVGGGLELLLDTYSLAAARLRLQEVILIFTGDDGEGKSPLLSTLGRSLWGFGHGDASSPMLLIEGEFRKQGHLYQKPRRVAFDGSNSSPGFVEEAFKLFAHEGLFGCARTARLRNATHLGLTTERPGT